MAYSSIFDIIEYSNQDGLWKIHLVARTPPPSSASDVWIDVPEAELPSNINQNQLKDALKGRLGWKLNQTFAPLNQLIQSGGTVTLP